MYALIMIAMLGIAFVVSYYVLPALFGIEGAGARVVSVLAALGFAKLIQIVLRGAFFQRMRERRFRRVLERTERRVDRYLSRRPLRKRDVKRARNAIANLRRDGDDTFTGPGYHAARVVASSLEARLSLAAMANICSAESESPTASRL